LAPELAIQLTCEFIVNRFNEGAPSLAPEPPFTLTDVDTSCASMRGRQAWRPNGSNGDVLDFLQALQ